MLGVNTRVYSFGSICVFLGMNCYYCNNEVVIFDKSKETIFRNEIGEDLIFKNVDEAKNYGKYTHLHAGYKRLNNI
jgi:hypothetical protein